MPHVTIASPLKAVTGTQTIAVPKQLSHHAVKITSADTTMTFTLKERDARADGDGEYSAFDDNAVSVNKKTTLVLPGCASLEITPSNGSTYTVSVSSY